MGDKRVLKGNRVPFSKLVIESAMEIGLYPYFIPVTGEQGHRVEINGKDTVMLGSNNYLGLTEMSGTPWAIHPDGDRFLMIKPPAGASSLVDRGPRKINIVLNWDEELKQRVPVD